MWTRPPEKHWVTVAAIIIGMGGGGLPTYEMETDEMENNWPVKVMLQPHIIPRTNESSPNM